MALTPANPQSTARPKGASALPTKTAEQPLAAFAYVAALFFLFLGQRVLPTITWVRWGFVGLGIVAMVASIMLRSSDAAQTKDDRREVERGLLRLTLLGFAAIVVQLVLTEEGEKLIHLATATPKTRDRIETIATCGWIAMLTWATIPLLFAERALYPMRRAERIEARRVVTAKAAGLALALAATYASLITYTVGELDWKVDFSYFRTARASESTKKMLASAGEDITIQSFFPRLDDVGMEVDAYLRDLTKGIPNVKLEAYDRLLVPTIARDSHVTQDGVIVLKRGTQVEPFVIGADMTAARPKLKTLDADFQKTLVRVLKQQKTAYLTVGHGELNEGTEGRATRGIRKVMESQGYTVKDFGLAQGLGNQVPDDATVVMVLGPAQPMLPGEMMTLRNYINRGGHVLLALDGEPRIDQNGLAELAQVNVVKGVLANDKIHVKIRFNPSDNLAIVTNAFSSHAAVSTLSRNSSRAPLFFNGAVGLDKWHGTDPSYKLDFAVNSLPGTFADTNENFEYDSGESKNQFHLAAALSKAVPNAAADKDAKDKDPKKAADTKAKAANETRIFAVGDADVFSDMFFENGPNVIFFLDALRWLGGEESFAGEITSTEDVKIEHTKQADLVWFYSVIVGVPSLVLGLGLFISFRKRKLPLATTRPATGGAA